MGSWMSGPFRSVDRELGEYREMEKGVTGPEGRRARAELLAGSRLRAERYDGHRARRSGYFLLVCVAMAAMFYGLAAVSWVELVAIGMVARETEQIRALSRAEMELKR